MPDSDHSNCNSAESVYLQDTDSYQPNYCTLIKTNGVDIHCIDALDSKRPKLYKPIEEDIHPPKKKYTAHQWTLLFMLAFINFGTAAIVSIQAPFYPAEAEGKGATAAEYGLVFGIYELIIFIASPIYGKYIMKIGPKFLLNAGISTNAVCCILFGFLGKVNDRTKFLAFSFVIRILQGLGEAGYITAAFSLVAEGFPSSVETTFGFLQMFFGLGVIAGPTLGGALYQVGGFLMPFAISGSLLLAASIATFFLLKSPCRDLEEKGSLSVLSVLKIVPVTIFIITVFCGSSSMGFLAATLEPHIRQFQLSPFLNGLMFVVGGGVFAVTSPLWGRFSDHGRNSKIICAVASISVCVSFTLLGPAPYMPFDTTLWLCIVALVFQGIGAGGQMVGGFIGSLYEVKTHGYPNNLRTYGLVSSLWGSAFALGAFVGPTVGGILLDKVGFRNGTLFIITEHALLACLNFVYLLYRRHKTKKINEETKPLLSDVKSKE